MPYPTQTLCGRCRKRPLVRTARGHATWCASCRRWYGLEKKYGITKKQYKSLLKKQNKVCAICKQPETRTTVTKNLSVDHDHSSGEIRGLLCYACNHALGLLKEDPVLLQAALKYLQGEQS
jgi:hypothetical protein